MTELEVSAYKFRTAIETAIASGEQDNFFRKFPVGQCGHTTDMLIQFLLDQGFQHVFYVNGIYHGDDVDNEDGADNRWRHTWLEHNGIIADITGDQFKNHQLPLKYDVPVYVGPIDEWHKQFAFEHGSYYEHHGIEKSWSNYYDLVHWYEIIKKYL